MTINILLVLICSPLLAQAPFSDPGNLGQWKLVESSSDEFNGSQLDTEKWFVQGTGNRYENRFKGRAPSQFVPANVGVKDGNLVITSKWQPDYKFAEEKFSGSKYEKITSGAVVSKSTFLYGYLETRCKAADGPISSSFWTTGKNGELDVFEVYGQNPTSSDASNRFQSSFHDWRTPRSPTYGKRIWTNEHQLPFRVADDFHVYAMEWNPDYIKIFVDGNLVRCASRKEIGKNWVVDQAQKIWLDSETFPWEVKPELLKESDFPAGGRQYIVDYVRVWQSEIPGKISPERRNLLSNPMFENEFKDWSTSGNVTLQEERTQSFAGSNHVGIQGGGNGALEQTVPVKPNTTYVVSAYAKAPATDYKEVFHDGWLGVKNYDGGFQTAQFFKSYWHRKSIQFKTGPNAKTATVFFTNQWSDEPVLVDDFKLVEAVDNSK